VVNELAPKDRDIAMVFQSYALYPHMTVRENMGFGLKLARVDRAEIDRKVNQAAELLELTELLDRKPANLSGGQRQRVAMGQAIVRSPQAFLMDEPLSNLDAKLRVQMRTTVARLQNQLGTTTVYVTHDQTEAMTLGDRVAVMRAGVIQQVGASEELYQRPRNLFVAGFIGSPAMNFLPGTLEDGRLRTPLGDVVVPAEMRAKLQRAGAGRDLIVGIRPEHFEDAALVGGRPRHRQGAGGAGRRRRHRRRAGQRPGRRPARSRQPGPGGSAAAAVVRPRQAAPVQPRQRRPPDPVSGGAATRQRESRKVSTARTRR